MIKKFFFKLKTYRIRRVLCLKVYGIANAIIKKMFDVWYSLCWVLAHSWHWCLTLVLLITVLFDNKSLTSVTSLKFVKFITIFQKYFMNAWKRNFFHFLSKSIRLKYCTHVRQFLVLSSFHSFTSGRNCYPKNLQCHFHFSLNKKITKTPFEKHFLIQIITVIWIVYHENSERK